MSLEERIKYYDDKYEVNNLPENITAQEFFDEGLLDYLLKQMFVGLRSKDFVELFKNGATSQNYMDKLVLLFCKNGQTVNENDFNTLMFNNDIANNFINSFIKVLNNNEMVKSRTIQYIFNSNNLLDRIINNSLIDVTKLDSVLTNDGIRKESILKLLSDQRFLYKLINYDLPTFVKIINSRDLSIELNEIIQNRFDKASYMEILNIVKSKTYYNVETGEPKYLQPFYYAMEDKINSDKKRSVLCDLKPDSSLELRIKAEEIVNTEEGMNILLKEVTEPQFSNVINILHLDPSLYDLRKNILSVELNNYEKYDVSTVKNVLCEYCFNDNSRNITLRLKTLIEYASRNREALKLMKEKIHYLIKLYSFLTKDYIECNPLDLVSDININELIREAHNIFSKDINKKTDITDILNSSNYKDIDGVKVIDVDIPLERSYFIVHSDSDYPTLDEYKEGAKKHNRICMSVLDNNHMNTFLDGIVFGYCNIEAPIYSALPFDGQTNQRRMEVGKPQFRSILSSVDTFMKRTTGVYNELTYKTDNELILPSYILVANREPNEKELAIAKEYNIPILIYHQKDISHEVEEGYSNGETFDYETHYLDYIPNKYSISMGETTK